MALPIASIPVLTGEVAQRFETEAQANYEKFLNRTPEEEKAVRERYDRGMAIIKKRYLKTQVWVEDTSPRKDH